MFSDRVDAGRKLAKKLEGFRGGDIVVLGLPRGGVPVAAEVAAHLGAPLDIIGVRKLGAPWQEELAMGAIGEGGVRVLNDSLIQQMGISSAEVDQVERAQQQVLAQRLALFRQGAPELSLSGKTAIIVDDGMATGSTAAVACQVARARGAARVILAVPVAPLEEAESFTGADQLVVVETPSPFYGVGAHYRDFSQISDESVGEILRQTHR